MKELLFEKIKSLTSMSMRCIGLAVNYEEVKNEEKSSVG